MIRHVTVTKANAISDAFVAVVQRFGDSVKEVCVQIASVVWCGAHRNDGVCWVSQVIGDPPDRADVLRVCVVVVGPHKRCRSLRFGIGDLGLRS